MFLATFIKTFVDLILRPRRVFEQQDNYLNPWKFTLPLGTTTIFVVRSLNLEKFNFEATPAYYDVSSTSDRLRDYLELQKTFQTSYQFQVGLFMIIILMIPAFLLLFKKARTDFRKFFSVTIYSSGIQVFLIYLLMSVINTLGGSVSTFISISVILSTIYFIYVWVSFFGSKTHVYLKLVSLLIGLQMLPPIRVNFLNLYVRMFQPQAVIYPSINTEQLLQAKTEPFRNFLTFMELNDTTSLLISQIDSLISFDLAYPNSSKNIKKTSKSSFFFLEADTLRSYRLINEENGTLVAENLWPIKENPDTLVSDLFFIRNAELLNVNQHIFLGRDSTWRPSLVIYNKLSGRKRLITFENPELNGQTFDKELTISDSLAIITSYKVFDNIKNGRIVTSYWCHLFNYKTGKIIRSYAAFERTGQYGLEEMPDLEIAQDSAIVISYTIANNQNNELWITLVSMIDLKVIWKKSVATVNDRINGAISVKYLKNRIYFLGNASLYIHKYWFEQEITYSFIGALTADGTNPEIKYFRQSKNHFSLFKGFYKLGKELYFTGIKVDNNINTFTLLFPTRNSFTAKVSDNFP